MNDEIVELAGRRPKTFGRRKMMPRACVADSKRHLRAFLAEVLEDLGFVTSECASPDELRAVLTGELPDLIMFGSTYDGRDVLARLSVKLDRPVLTNNIDVAEEGGTVQCTTQIFGGTTVVTTAFKSEAPHLANFRPKSFAAEPGTYLLTDYLIRSFDKAVIQPLGLDRHPELWTDYFGHYRRLAWLAQEPTAALEAAAARIASQFGLPLTRIDTGTSGLEAALAVLLEE